MVLPVESRVYAPLSVPRTLPARPLKDTGALTDSAHKNAQNFLENLPPDVRERVGQVYRDSKERQNFSAPERSEKDRGPEKTGREASPPKTDNFIRADFQQPIFTQPILTPTAALLQVQFAAANDASETQEASLSPKEHEAFHAAYLSAGAQPGGRAAALAARIAQEELTQRATVVLPVVTSVNLSA